MKTLSISDRLSKRKRRSQRSESSSQVECQSEPPPQPPRKRSEKRGAEFDAAIANIQSALEATDGLLSMIPVPGLSPALDLIKAVIGRVKDTRENIKGKDELLESINALVQLLNSSMTDMSPEMESMDAGERQEVQKKLLESTLLRHRIDGLVCTLQDIVRSAQDLQHRNWLSQAWHSENDAQTLQQMRTKIDVATTHFQIQGEITVQQLLAGSVQQAREATVILKRIEKEQREYHERRELDRMRTELEQRERALRRDEAQAKRDERERQRFEREEREATERRMYESVHTERERLEDQRKLQAEQREADDRALKKLIFSDASYKSYLTEEKSRLQPGTRKKILARLGKWSTQLHLNRRVFVLHGRAGMGKSSIVHALLRDLSPYYITTSFFFNRGIEECVDPYRLAPTLATQLAHANEELHSLVANAVRKHFGTGNSQGLVHQIQELLIDPLRQLQLPMLPVVMVVDGIDECLNSPDYLVPDMLRLLCQAAAEIPFLRVVIATRPEGYIMDALRYCDHSDLITFYDLQKEPDVDRDIRLFIDTEFAKCARRGPFILVQQRPNAAAELTRLADGLFVFASTIVRFLVRDRHYAVKIYDMLLASEGSLGPAKMYHRVDILYSAILDVAFSELRDDAERMAAIHQVLTWLGLIDSIAEGLSPASLELVGIPTYVTMDVMDRLRSVLVVEQYVTPTAKLRAYHASFPQFLVDGVRCKDRAFFVEPGPGHALIASSLLDFLSRSPPDILRPGVDPELTRLWTYANHHWHIHLYGSERTDELYRSLLAFSETRLEQWLVDTPPWSHPFPDNCQALDEIEKVRIWCQEDSSCNKRIVKQLKRQINKRVRGLILNVSRSPQEFSGNDVERVMSWNESGYVPEVEGNSELEP